MSFLTLSNIHYCYKEFDFAIKDVSWQVNEGEFHSLLGKSGCGKTTLLKLAAGLLKPDEGKIYLKREEVFKPSSQIGYVFQSPTLLEWKTVIDNVLLPISLQRKPSKEELNYAEELLQLVGIISHKDKYPTELSGGQQSRVAIARALIQKPIMLFLDEPFAALDAITREEIQDDLLKLCKMEKTTVLFITHDITEAVYLSDHIAIISEGEIIRSLRVNLPKERSFQMRYEPYFNDLCLDIRKSLGGG
ncbi:NitT/TauT family transport system ATP-binding protein [Desulfonispora thiosulfatigenes DSM 11270]|uniref:NitT/TauT family transport system ATP-binding protein n=1 Tax=Desulfonispora thiosulfatigenes DSM 11270 TaxID=656914 RepID=A0A1W1UIB7_DESTI|nr:ABC transporter ATP-binding protein [Desulfonispora thiosulfatigenes]SMB80817.1 NitT/TauT family transport system ATP-binding protein [Desulfonispora thiosulfatigenes DSM 11270]